MVLAAIFASLGIASSVPVAEALSLISGSLCAILFFFGMNTPAHAPIPVRVRRRR
jgi:hypothetical protein